MRDLLRNYKMTVKRKDESDSDAESQPLVSSHSSVSSYETLRENCIFPDSETTDGENETPKRMTLTTTSANRPVYRRSFCYPRSYERNLLLKPCASHESICFVDRYDYFPATNRLLSDRPLIHHKSLLNISYKDYTEFECAETHSSVVTIFAIWNTIMGTSLLAMSWGLERAGLVPGVFLNVFLCGLCLYTAYLLLKVSEHHGLAGQTTEVPELCGMLLGRWAEVLAKTFSLVVLFGANVVYWILMSNFLYNSVDFLYGYVNAPPVPIVINISVMCDNPSTTNDTPLLVVSEKTPYYRTLWDMYSTVPVLLGVIMFPLLNFRSATFFTKFNSLGTFSVVYLLAFVCVKASVWGINVPEWSAELRLKPTFCALSGMLSLGYFIHNIIISVMKNNRNQDKNGRDLSIAFGLVLFTYVFTGALFYIAFPLPKSCIEDNFLNNFEKHDVLAIVARLLFLFQLLTVFPLMTYMLRMEVFTNLNDVFKGRGYGEFTYGRVVVLNLVVVVVCVLFACFLPRIGTLIRYTGAFSGVVYVFTLPCLLSLASLRKRGNLTAVKMVGFVAIVAVGFANLFSQFFISDH